VLDLFAKSTYSQPYGDQLNQELGIKFNATDADTEFENEMEIKNFYNLQ
jgi:hypothetical protein